MEIIPMRTALTIAGSDSGGGAGIQADLKTFAALGVHGMSALTAITAQNTETVTAVHPIPPEIVAAQIDAVASDLGVDAAKTGMLFSTEIIEAVADRVRHWGFPLVVDPVMIAKGGAPLLKPDAMNALTHLILPLATVVTPNAWEAAALIGHPVETLEDAQAAARAIADLGPRAVVVKGGHINTDAQDLTSSERAKGAGRAVDVLYTGGTIQLLERERIATRTDHGTGCTFAAAIAAGLALGLSLTDAILQAKEVVTLAVRFGLPIGKGHGPVNPLATLYREADRAAVMANVSDAVRILEDNPESARLAPESQINIAMAIPAPRSVTDVCGVRGRVILVGDRLRAGGAPAFGASRHVARTLLVASDHDPRIRAAMNIRYSEAILRAAGALGLLVSWYDRREEPPEVKAQEGATTSWGATQAIARVGRVPDIIYHTGDWGKEPMMIILGESAVAVAQTALRLARSLSE